MTTFGKEASAKTRRMAQVQAKKETLRGWARGLWHTPLRIFLAGRVSVGAIGHAATATFQRDSQHVLLLLLAIRRARTDLSRLYPASVQPGFMSCWLGIRGHPGRRAQHHPHPSLRNGTRVARLHRPPRQQHKSSQAQMLPTCFDCCLRHLNARI